jgi:hypothetical protein
VRSSSPIALASGQVTRGTRSESSCIGLPMPPASCCSSGLRRPASLTPPRRRSLGRHLPPPCLDLGELRQGLGQDVDDGARHASSTRGPPSSDTYFAACRTVSIVRTLAHHY